jgi:hypothetical protein
MEKAMIDPERTVGDLGVNKMMNMPATAVSTALAPSHLPSAANGWVARLRAITSVRTAQ